MPGDDAALFQLAPATGGENRPTSRQQRPARTLRYDICHVCHSPGRPPVGQVADGTQLVWREHYVTTRSGAAILCRASGTRVDGKRLRGGRVEDAT